MESRMNRPFRAYGKIRQYSSSTRTFSARK